VVVEVAVGGECHVWVIESSGVRSSRERVKGLPKVKRSALSWRITSPAIYGGDREGLQSRIVEDRLRVWCGVKNKSYVGRVQAS